MSGYRICDIALQYDLREGVKHEKIAKAYNYKYVVSVDSYEKLDDQLEVLKENNELSLIEVKCAIDARKNLVRPITTAKKNKNDFMKYLGSA